MTKQLELPGDDDRDDGRFEKAFEKDDGQIDYYVGNQQTGEHCHMYRNEETGSTGVVHRGECAVCEDEKKDD